MATAPIQDEQWIMRLTAANPSDALRELRMILQRSLSNFAMTAEDKEDVLSKSLSRIVDKIGTFKGNSKFLTWAISVAVNTALSEVRAKRWDTVSLETAAATGLDEPGSARDDPSFVVQRQWAVTYIEELIVNELTTKQRLALLAELNGMPIPEIAKRLNVTPGAIYKLTFDARRKLIKCLSEKGLTPQDLIGSAG